MLLVLLRQGSCKKALDAVAAVFGGLASGGPEYETAGGELVTFCHEAKYKFELIDVACPTDYLVLRYNTARITGGDPDYYDPSAVTPEMVLRYRRQVCELLERLRGDYYLAIVTTQPYLTVFGVYFGERPPPVTLLGVELGGGECAVKLYRDVVVNPRDVLEQLELPVAQPPPSRKFCEGVGAEAIAVFRGGL